MLRYRCTCSNAAPDGHKSARVTKMLAPGDEFDGAEWPERLLRTRLQNGSILPVGYEHYVEAEQERRVAALLAGEDPDEAARQARRSRTERVQARAGAKENRLTRRERPNAPATPWNLDPDGLQGMELSKLNAMVAERDPDMEPFDDEAEAVAQLSRDYVAPRLS